MATLTYDPTEPQEGEFSAEEMDSLRVGEALEEDQQELLAGKFKDAQDLEQAYIELQRKLGDPSQRDEDSDKATVDEDQEEQEEPSTDFLDRLWQESQDEYSEETLKALEEMDAADLAQMYLEYRNEVEESSAVPQVTENDVVEIKGSVGGDEAYSNMIAWASQNLGEQEIAMYDAVMERGDPLGMFFAVQALAARFYDASGVDGEMLTGRAPGNEVQGFRSQAELVRAMSDPRYENDPAYRFDIEQKLERSNLEF